MNNRHKIRLSQPGQLRRAQMLDDLQKEVTQNPKRRFRRRLTIAVVPVVLLTFVLFRTISVGRNDVRVKNVVENSPGITVETTVVSASRFSPENVVVGNRDGVISRYVVHTEQSKPRELNLISDDELLELLDQMGKPSVLGRIDGKLSVFAATIPQQKAAN